jgi:hypothetical protein
MPGMRADRAPRKNQDHQFEEPAHGKKNDDVSGACARSRSTPKVGLVASGAAMGAIRFARLPPWVKPLQRPSKPTSAGSSLQSLKRERERGPGRAMSRVYATCSLSRRRVEKAKSWPSDATKKARHFTGCWILISLLFLSPLAYTRLIARPGPLSLSLS